MRLNLGAGQDKRKGYINVDAVEQFAPDKVWDLSVIPMPFVSAGEVIEILAQDILEHFDPFKAHELLAYWVSLLRPGGVIHLQVPDWSTLDKNNLENVFGAAIFKGVYTGAFGSHKWGYTKASLQSLMHDCGLVDIMLFHDSGQLRTSGSHPM